MRSLLTVRNAVGAGLLVAATVVVSTLELSSQPVVVEAGAHTRSAALRDAAPGRAGSSSSSSGGGGSGCETAAEGAAAAPPPARRAQPRWREPYVHPYRETFSSHHCMEHNKGWNLRRCKINYLCHWHGGLWYFMDGDEARQQPVDTNFNGVPTGPAAANPWLSLDTRGIGWAPSIATKSLEAFAAENGARVQWHGHPLVFLMKHACANAGHCVLENMFPVFMDLLTWVAPLCKELGCSPYNNTILMLEHMGGDDCGCGAHRLACGTGANETPDRCTHFVAQTLGLLSDRPPAYINHLPSFAGDVMECWPEAYAGHGGMLPYMDGMSWGVYNHAGGYLRLMRDAVYERTRVVPLSLAHRAARLTTSRKLHVLAAKKAGRRVIANFDDAVGWLRALEVVIDGARYSLDIHVIDWYDHPTTEAQVALLGDTDIYFTSAGSASIQALFLPDYTAMVTTVLCDPRNGHIEVGYCDSFEHQIVHTHASAYHSYIYAVDSLDELPDSAAPESKDIKMTKDKTLKLVSQAATAIVREVLAAAAIRGE